MALTKRQIEITEHFTNLVIKSLEIRGLKDGLMSMLAAKAEPGAFGEFISKLGDKAPSIEEVREDLEASRTDMWDMMEALSDTVDEWYDEIDTGTDDDSATAGC